MDSPVITGMDGGNVPRHNVSCRMPNPIRLGPAALVLLFATASVAEESLVPDAAQWSRIEKAMPAQATDKPEKPRRLLIFNRNVEYNGHRASILAGSEAFRQFGKKTGAFETTISEDPAAFDRDSLRKYDAVFLNNNIGSCVSESERRKNLLEFVTAGGGLMGVHGTSLAFTKWQWPPLEDWAEFGHMIGARGARHRGGYVQEPVVMALDDATHPLLSAFEGNSHPWSDEIFRFHDPYSRKNVRVLLRIDTDRTDLSTYLPDDKDQCLRPDNDYALAWIRSYGKGRVFYSALAHSPHVFEDGKMLRFYLDAAQFVLGDLSANTTPSAYLTDAVRAQEKLGWRIGIEAYTFHKYTFFEAIDKTAELGLPYVGGLSFMQQVSKEIPKNFDQNLSDDDLLQIRMKMESAGVRMPVYYAQTIPSDEAACRKLFEFGNKMGIETFICEPKAEQLELLDKLANEYAINIGIHNHGPDISPHLWKPEMVLALCEGRSKRIGAAPDLGYWLRLGIDPIEAVRLLKDRILTVQMHDLHERGPNGHDVPWGSGTGRAKEFFQELHRHGIRPTMIGLEYSREWLESMPKLAKCIEFFNTTTLELSNQP
jgi:type 1 glutamine amidotransferase/sugar phosphate isomerase/epimerase